MTAAVELSAPASVAKAQPFGNSERHEATAATSPAAPTIDAGNCPGGPENRSLNGNSIVTAPAAVVDIIRDAIRAVAGS